ncbi:cyclic nucleotide-binding domain-containing protein [Streptomyces sp. M19]
MREAEESTFVLILLDGVVKATGRTHDNRDALLAVRMGGDLVGEFAAVDGRPRSATVTTCGPVVARAVTRATSSTACGTARGSPRRSTSRSWRSCGPRRPTASTSPAATPRPGWPGCSTRSP